MNLYDEPHRYVVYRWLTTDDFLVSSLVPGCLSIEGSVNHGVDQVMEEVPGDATHFHFHLNSSLTGRFPRSRETLVGQLRERGIVTVNADVIDITKRTIQRRCAELGLPTTHTGPAGDPDDIIIVKTDLNFGGASEWGLSDEERDLLGMAPGSDIIWKPAHYRVVRRAEVEPLWWTDERLICERYVENPDHRWYRAFVFLSRCVLCELVEDSTIKKVGTSHLESTQAVRLGRSTDEPDPSFSEGSVLHALSRFINSFRLEFGAVDVMLDSQEVPYIIDVNTTPAHNNPVPGLIEGLGQALSD